MTYSDIVKMALAHLEYGTDDDSVAAFNERFMIYANDAVRIIASDLRMSKTIETQLHDGVLTLDADYLRENFGTDITKIDEVYVFDRNRKILLPFVIGDTDDEFRVWGCAPNDFVHVRYRYLPKYETDGDAVPAIPEAFHPIIYLYIVHCHHNTRSTATDFDRTKWLQQFNAMRKRISRQAYGALNTYAVCNKPWQTGEM